MSGEEVLTIDFSDDIVFPSLSQNHEKSVNNGVTADTYIPFIIIECLA